MHLLCSKGWSLRYTLGVGATLLAALWHCLRGRGLRGDNASCLALALLEVISLTTQANWALLVLIPGCVGICVHSRTLWVSPTNSPVRLGVSSTTETPTGFSVRGFVASFPPCWNPGFCGLSSSPVVPPSLSSQKCGTARGHLAHLVLHPCRTSSPPQLPLSAPLLVWMSISSLTP